MAARVFVASAIAAVAAAQVPNKTPTYQLNQSTIIMPCNNSGFTDPQTTVGWSIIDFDCACACFLVVVRATRRVT